MTSRQEKRLRCSRCRKEKPESSFHRNRARATGRQNYCKKCVSASSKKWFEDHPQKSREYERQRYDRDPEKEKRRRRDNQCRIRYSISLEEYEQLISEGCSICGALPDDIQIVMDHDHQSGSRRAPLCHRCNVLLGWADDDPDRLRAAADYLETHKQKEVVN